MQELQRLLLLCMGLLGFRIQQGYLSAQLTGCASVAFVGCWAAVGACCALHAGVSKHMIQLSTTGATGAMQGEPGRQMLWHSIKYRSQWDKYMWRDHLPYPKVNLCSWCKVQESELRYGAAALPT